MTKSTWILIGLSVAITVLSVGMVVNGSATPLEAASFLTGAACVWLTVKENVWNFPLGLVNVATFSVVFFDARLFADASLQVVYFVLGIIGWYMWLRGGEKRTALVISRTTVTEAVVLTVLVAAGTVVMWKTLHLLNGSSSFWDALTTAISLAAQWLLNKKRLENWVAWIIVDIVYVPLYLYKGLMLTSMLYAVFLIMATMGLLQWRQTLRRLTTEAALPAEEVAA